MIPSEKNRVEGKNGCSRKPLGIYVHIPFCRQKCRYCDFVSFAKGSGDPDFRQRYIAALKRELARQAVLLKDRYQVDTIYFGGGTPTMLDVGQINDVVEEIFRLFSVVGRDRLEMTIEANPESVDALQCRRMEAGGFNRVSLGVQSLDDALLRRLGRVHDARTAEESFKRIQGCVTDNINVDLMFGLPGQTAGIWRDTLVRVASWEPAHVSFYSLQLEEGTSFYSDYKAGKIDLPPWDVNRQMYRSAVKHLGESGYEHYEVSSTALPGRFCRHNLKYWTMGEYLGVGLAAHSYLENVRSENTADLDAYTAGEFSDKSSAESVEEQIGDYLFTTLRKIYGFEYADFKTRFETDFLSEFGTTTEALIREGLLISDGRSLRFTNRGLDRTNLVLSRLLNREGGSHGK